MICGTALALLLDVSGSIGADQWDTMRAGHAAALRTPAVIRAAESDGLAIAALQFDHATYPAMGWRVLRSAADVESAAQAFDTMDRQSIGNTHTGSAVMAGPRALEEAPCGDTQILDLATDGGSNGGTPLTQARDAAHAAGVRINVLLVAGTSLEADDLRQRLVTPGGFLLEAREWSDFGAALRRKLVQEIGAR